MSPFFVEFSPSRRSDRARGFLTLLVQRCLSFIAGANYRWDELRKDQRNYTLIIWPTRSAQDSQEIDVRAVLRHEATGRDVWQDGFKNPYRMRSVRQGGFTRAERLEIVRAMSGQIVGDMQKQGVLPKAGS